MDSQRPLPAIAHRWLPFALCALTVLAYLPSLDGGFLNYDDPWLIETNPNLAPGVWDTPIRAFTTFDRAGRLTFGAEYLPLRDLSVWLETRVFGLWPQGMRGVNLGLYLLAVLGLWGTLRRVVGGWPAEFAALLFALHPVHVESVAWLAGRKDVLALAFVCGALFVHAGASPRRWLTVPLLVLCASLSKSMSIAVIMLMGASDLYLNRRPDWRVYAPTLAMIAGTLALHLHVGSVVGMVAEPAGGSRATAVITMGPVWLRYLAMCLYPPLLSIVYDVPDRLSWDLMAAAGYGFMFAWAALAWASYRRGAPLLAFCWLWFFGPLGPVSQVIAPLQNRLADRYAWLSVLAPCLLLAWWLSPDRGRYPIIKTGALALLACAALWFTATRAVLFTDAVALFADASTKTRHATVAPYQLGKALEALGQDREAELAFRAVLARSPSGPQPDAARATNNLARLLARRGELVEAEALLVRGVQRFPRNGKIRGNLVKVLAKQGRHEDARAVDEGRAP